MLYTSNMADSSRAEKLAAARKMLKQFQQKGKDGPPTGIKISGKKITPEPQLVEDGNSSEQNLVFDSGPMSSEHSKTGIGTSVGRELQTFIEPSLQLQGNLNEPAVVILENTDTYNCTSHDKINESNVKEYNISYSGLGNEVEKNAINSIPADVSIATFPPLTVPDRIISAVATAGDFFDNLSSYNHSLPSDGSTGITLGEKESEQVTTPHQLFPLSSCETVDVADDSKISVSSSIKGTDSGQSVVFQNFDTATFKESVQVIDSKVDQNVIDNQHVTQNTNVVLSTPEHSSNARSSTESLRQLSLQMNGLIEESARDNATHREDSELERRNQELAALLAAECQKCEQLNLQLKEYQSRMCQLQVEMDQLRTESEARVTRETGPIQEQLQVHVQTVGILVGEKTELQAALMKSQNIAKQKASEVEELQGRLKASRYRVMDLEKEVSSLQGTNESLEKVTHELSCECDKLKLENSTTSKQLLEKEEEISELHQKLNAKVNDYVVLQQELQEKLSQLSLTQLRVQQLSSADSNEVDGQLETMHQQKVSLEKQVADLQQTVKTVGLERDQASQQYQQYVQQLNGQLHSLASKVESLSSENEQLVTREQGLVLHVSDLEKQLQQLQQNQKRRDSSPKQLKDSSVVQELEAKLELAERKRLAVIEKLDCQLQENQNIQKELEERNCRIEDLESMLERYECDQPDKDKLLAAMESDKVAAALAVGQNQRLKVQLEELQDGFVKMSNDKLELTEKLQHERRICKEQGDSLAKQEEELNDLRMQLLQKEQLFQQTLSELSNQSLQRSHTADHTSQYEGHGQLNEFIQQELEQAKECIQALSVQNSELRTILAQQASIDSGSSSGEDTLSRKDEMLASLSASVKQLELERDQLLEQLKHQEQHEREQHSLQQNFPDSDSVSTNLRIGVNPRESESVKAALEKLEDRFTRTMKEVADLTDEKQRLEHLVLQLQGETETIGEYIALYQVQRTLLRQRAQEKDEQLSKLSKDREEMRNKLSELTKLVQQLLAEKESLCKIIHGIPIEHSVGNTSVNYKPQEEEGIANSEIVEIEKSVEVNETTQLIPPPGDNVPSVLEADTAGRIMALLSELGSRSLLDPQCNESFHPCPWCSGRLITV